MVLGILVSLETQGNRVKAEAAEAAGEGVVGPLSQAQGMLEVVGLGLVPGVVLVVFMLQLLVLSMRFLVKQAMLDLLDQQEIQDAPDKPGNQVRV